MASDRPSARQSGPDGREPPGASDANAGWAIFGYLISGMAVYGGVGWLIARWTHVPVIFPIGMLVGLALGIVLIVFKYGRA